MGTSERRLEILKYLCKARKAKMTQLAEMFDVSVRTIQRDIYIIEYVFCVPIIIKYGRYYGGIYIIGNYNFDHTYMFEEEINLLKKVKYLSLEQLSSAECHTLDKIITTYTKETKEVFHI